MPSLSLGFCFSICGLSCQMRKSQCTAAASALLSNFFPPTVMEANSSAIRSGVSVSSGTLLEAPIHQGQPPQGPTCKCMTTPGFSWQLSAPCPHFLTSQRSWEFPWPPGWLDSCWVGLAGLQGLYLPSLETKETAWSRRQRCQWFMGEGNKIGN